MLCFLVFYLISANKFGLLSVAVEKLEIGNLILAGIKLRWITRSGSDVLSTDEVVFAFVIDYVKHGIVICIDLS